VRCWRNRGVTELTCTAKPFVVESAVQAVLNHLAEGDPKYAKHKPTEFIEPGPLADLDHSGYIDGLYAGQDKKTR
jgi:hypothetical protein